MAPAQKRARAEDPEDSDEGISSEEERLEALVFGRPIKGKDKKAKGKETWRGEEGDQEGDGRSGSEGDGGVWSSRGLGLHTSWKVLITV